jgi:hypothetical protein
MANTEMDGHPAKLVGALTFVKPVPVAGQDGFDEDGVGYPGGGDDPESITNKNCPAASRTMATALSM